MWWVWVVVVVAVIALLVFLLQRRGNTGMEGYQRKDPTTDGQVGTPPGQFGDGGGGF
jgi:hypothetical protein